MTYPDGNTFTVTDGNVKYKAAYSNANNETTWSVFEGAAEKVLNKQTVTESSTGTTYVEKYYNADAASPTYTETTVKNNYGRVVTKGAATYRYDPLDNESPSCHLLDFVEDNNTGTVTEYSYKDGSLTGVKLKLNNATQINIEKIERLKLKYEFGGGDNYQMLILYDDTFAGSTRVKGRTVYLRICIS